MQIVCTHENLKKGLGITSRVSNGSSTLPVLNNILLKTDQGMLKLSSTNLEIGVNTWLRCRVEEEGGVSIPSKTLTDLITNLPNDKITLKLEGNLLLIESGGYQTKIKGLGVDEFPLIPEVDQTTSIEIPGKDLKEAISQVAFAAAYSETQPEISGVLFSFEDDKLKIAATDRYRLAEKIVLVKTQNINKNLIIPNKAIQELSKLLSGEESEIVHMFIAQNQIMFKTNETEIISRLIDGQYPDYKHIIPDQFNTEIECQTADIVSAMRTAGIFTQAGNNVSLEYKEPDFLLAQSSSGELGESRVSIASKVKGEEGVIIFNHRYILDGLSSIGTKTIVLKIINDNSPTVICSKELPGYLYLVMPIKI